MIYFNLNVIQCIQAAASFVSIRNCSDHLSTLSFSCPTGPSLMNTKVKSSSNSQKFSPISHTRLFFFLLLSLHVPKIAAVFYLRYQGKSSFSLRTRKLEQLWLSPCLWALFIQNWVLTKVEWWKKNAFGMNYLQTCHLLPKCNKQSNVLPICPMKNLNDQSQ